MIVIELNVIIVSLILSNNNKNNNNDDKNKNSNIHRCIKNPNLYAIPHTTNSSHLKSNKNRIKTSGISVARCRAFNIETFKSSYWKRSQLTRRLVALYRYNNDNDDEEEETDCGSDSNSININDNNNKDNVYLLPDNCFVNLHDISNHRQFLTCSVPFDLFNINNNHNNNNNINKNSKKSTNNTNNNNSNGLFKKYIFSLFLSWYSPPNEEEEEEEDDDDGDSNDNNKNNGNNNHTYYVGDVHMDSDTLEKVVFDFKKAVCPGLCKVCCRGYCSGINNRDNHSSSGNYSAYIY